MSSIEALHPWEYAHTLFSDPSEIKANLESGILDPESAEHYQQKHDHLVEVVHRGADGELKAVRLSGNLRNNAGGDWQAIAMGGDVTAGASSIATNSAATTLSDTKQGWTVNQWAYHIVSCGAASSTGVGSNVFGNILSNTATVLTVDKWYTAASSIGTQTGATPSASSQYQILPTTMPLRFLALSLTAGSASSNDTSLAGEITDGNGLARTEATFAHAAVTGASSGTNTSTYTLAKTFVATGTYTAVQKAAVFGSAVQSTSVPMFENQFSSVNLIFGDTLAVTWTINL